MITILGIDPGSRFTGYGIIRSDGNQYHYVASGCIKVKGELLSHKLQDIFHQLHTLTQTYLPEEAAIEQVFMHKNAQSALKLGQARGAAIVACAGAMLPVAEYAPRAIKQSVVGHGGADKMQVATMVRFILKLQTNPQEDEADALAVALCHANRRASKINLEKRMSDNDKRHKRTSSR